jgi:hypothetical protein
MLITNQYAADKWESHHGVQSIENNPAYHCKGSPRVSSGLFQSASGLYPFAAVHLGGTAFLIQARHFLQPLTCHSNQPHGAFIFFGDIFSAFLQSAPKVEMKNASVLIKKTYKPICALLICDSLQEMCSLTFLSSDLILVYYADRAWMISLLHQELYNTSIFLQETDYTRSASM